MTKLRYVATMSSGKPSSLSDLTVILIALLASELLLVTVGAGILFVALWTCVPEHALPPRACSTYQVPAALVLAPLASFSPLIAALWWIRRRAKS